MKPRVPKLDPRPAAALVALAAAALAAGCAGYHPAPLSATDSAAELERRSLTNADLRTFLQTNLHREFTNWPAPAWDFDMLTMAAYYYHPDLAVARAQWSVAEAAIRTAGGRPNPSISLIPGYAFTAQPTPSPWLPAISFDIPIETAGKRGKRIAAATQTAVAARLAVATVAWQVRSRLRSSVLDWAASQRRVEALKRQVSAQEQLVSLLDQREQAGAISAAEALSSRVSLQRLRLELADAESANAENRARVAEALGVTVASLPALEPAPGRVGPALAYDPLEEQLAPPEVTTAEARHRALLSRTDILGALADYAAAEGTLRLEIAKQYPDLHLSPGYQYNLGDHEWTLGLTFDLPILNRNEGPIAEAEARRAQSAASFKALQSKVLAEIDRAVEVYQATGEQSTALHGLTEAQARQRESAAKQFQAGAVDQQEWLSARIEYDAAALTELDAQVRRQQAAAALENAIQLPFTVPDAILKPDPKSAH